MKRAWMVLWVCLLTGVAVADVVIKQVDLDGRISEDELALKMTFEAQIEEAPVRIMVLEGGVVPTKLDLPRGAEMVLEDGTYYIEFGRNGVQDVAIDFEAKVFSSGQRRAAIFGLPSATVRRITLDAEKEGYKVEVENAPRTEKLDEKRLRAYLPPTGTVRINWSPELEKLSGELVASCDTILVGSAKVGALLLQGQFSYTIPQGRMKELSLALPAGLNIIQVSGDDVLAWDVREDDDERRLHVELSRPHEKQYVLTVQAEQSLSEFPCSFEFPVIDPQGVIRANGVVLVGTDSTIKLLVDGLGGLTQVEPDAVSWGPLSRPARGLYAYMFANMPFSMKLTADNIVTSLHAEDQLVLALSEYDASLDAKIDLEVRDAPTRDVELEVSKGWTVAAVEGQNVADYDVRDRDGSRWIKVYFKKAVDNRALLQVRLEKTLSDGATGFGMPRIKVSGARSERGFLVLRGETGTRLEGTDLTGLREVNTGSLPIRIADARQAFRFKSPDWTGRVSVRQEESSIHAESFQLVSLGESGVFGSSLITYNVANAPTRSFTLRIPQEYRNVEVNGRDIRTWTQEGEDWTIQLQQKVIGDYTLLVTYDHPAKYQGEELLAGGIRALDIENETGYIALAGAANLSLDEEIGYETTILPIDVAEIPDEYALLINDPIMHAYKYVASPHEARMRIKRFATQPLLTQVADHTTFDTTISKDGEAVTLAVYHVKNTDRQYFAMRLPELASLWSVKVEGSKVQVLDRGDGEVLIPVERRRDPNAPIKVEVTYAQQLKEPGRTSWMEFKAPEVDTQAVFARWAFRLPDGERLAAAKGNMEMPKQLADRKTGLGAMIFDSEMLGFWLFCVAVLSGVLYLLGRIRGLSFVRFVLGLLGLGALLVVGGVVLYVVLGLATGSADIPAEWVFSKSVSGSGGGLLVNFKMVGAGYEVAQNLLLLVAGLAPLGWVLLARKQKFMLPALALLAAVCAFSPYLAWVTLLLPLAMLFAACRLAGRRAGESDAQRHRGRKMPAYQPEMPTPGTEGSVQIKLLGMILAVMAVLSVGCATGHEAEPSMSKQAVAERVALSVDVPVFETETRVNINVHMELELNAETGETLQLLGPGFVIKNYDLSSRRLHVVQDEYGCTLHVDRDGKYKVSVDYLVEADYDKGAWNTHLWIPASLQNEAVITLPVEGWNLQSEEAIRIRQKGERAEVLFGSYTRLCALGWKPEERKTDLEQARFFCDVNTLADFRPGMVDLRHDVRFNIAQGELQNLRFDVPAGMSVTEVRGNEVATWRYDPDAGLLEVVLSVPATESYRMQIGAQIARDKLPYNITLHGIAVQGAAMQRGVVAMASPDAVQIDIDSADALSGINVGDAARLLEVSAEGAIKRAFRYNLLPFSASVSADEVLPELRLIEDASLDIATEQMRLTSRLNVTVSKSGIFALRIRIPEGFDIDSLTGDAVSHWDEVNGDTREVVVNFKRQIVGNVPLNLVLSRSGRDLETDFTMPRIRLDGVLKHTGTLGVTVERGIRITPALRDGVSEISPREMGIRQEGSLAYRLLRPDWSIQLHSEVLEPLVKAEVLQRVALSEGLLKVRCYVQYDIEHAGVKTFRLQPPSPELALVVSGRNIARVRRIDEAQGIWEVELHGKVEDRYGMEVAYQVPYAHDNAELVVHPLQALGTESQKGFVAIFSSGRLQVKPAEVPVVLRPEDARSIPRRFGAGDLSDAVLCYRATECDYALKLNAVRHNAADVLPAQVRSVRLDSLITMDGQTLNNMAMTLDPGSLRFLEMRLPEGAQIWSVFVNETAVHPLAEDGLYLVPMEPGDGQSASVEVMYAQSWKKSWFGRKLDFMGPQFKLPLRDVVWTFYAPDGYRYSGFDGTMEHLEVARPWKSRMITFSEADYIQYNADNSQLFGDSAKESIVVANSYMESGDQRSARKAFEKAISYSQGQQDLNEDARVQYRNLVRQQGVIGLVNRRNQLKQSLNLTDGNGMVPVEQWSGNDVQKIEAQLGEKESSALSNLAERMLDQQQAASVEVHPIRVVMAQQGSRLEFKRTLQLRSDSEMEVEFRATPARDSHAAQAVAVALSAGIIILSGGIFSRLRRAE